MYLDTIKIKEALDSRICDIQKDCDTTQTYREYIKTSEETFSIKKANLELMKENELKKYIYFLDVLWEIHNHSEIHL